MSVNLKIAEALERLAFEHREEGFQHHAYEEEMRQYELVMRGDMRSLEWGRRMFEGPMTGSLSDEPVKNYQYLFVASVTLTCRFCIEGGMNLEDAYNLSDLYIRQVDKCRSVQEIFELHDTMFRDYTTRMQRIVRKDVYSRQVHRCMNYIDKHLQQPLTVKKLAETLELSESYVSILFKRETGLAVSEYIRRRRIDSAKILLQYTEFRCLEIAEYLCFSSDSHFSRVFREYVGQSPKEYREQNYQSHWSGSSANVQHPE